MAVLALRALGLGDLLTGVPALRALRRAHPSSRLLLAAPLWQWPLARQCGVDQILAVEGVDGVDPDELGAAVRHWSAANDDPIDVAVNLHGRGPASTHALAGLEPRVLVAFAHSSAPRAAARVTWDPNEHEVRRWCRLLKGHGIRADPTDLFIDPPDVASPIAPGTIVIHPGAAAAARRWPPARFATVAAALLGAGREVAYTGSASEARLCAAVRASAGGGRVLAGHTDLAELTAAVAVAGAVISNDTGVAHLASACRTPSVVLFGPEPPSRWGPPADGPHRALWHGGLGNPHGTELDPALAAITVDEVLAALAEVMPAGTRP
jgi:ADP-heptose:LPS heptosyltransferase